MRIRRLFLIFGLITLIGCKQVDEKKPVNVEDEIAELQSLSGKEEYLEYILETDQNIRDGRSSEIYLKYGENSSEYQNFIYIMDSIEKLNLKRIDIYLKSFGYPSVDSVSRNASIAPWIVIHHTTDVEKRKKYFKYLFKAYKDGNLTTDRFEGYLGRTYQFQFGNYPSGEGAYNIDEKINDLIRKLGLEIN